MSGSIIKSAEFKTAINDMLKEYGDKCEDAMAEVTPGVANATRNKVKAGAQSVVGPHATGKYAAGWQAKIDKKNGGAGFKVYNARVPGLPHLIENGHALRNGGRTRPRKHIEPVNEWAQEEFVNRLRRKLS
ncbi:hypothetical protein [Pseudoramibacter alactolyticus]|uniref:hypothetical protein n=1 Tax=Pseudoramibacter alactolyticus TaxID=113287 RepID=UPI0028E9C7BE|nr:hypothetical protein [Pseudoramibacter alactolyticus]